MKYLKNAQLLALQSLIACSLFFSVSAAERTVTITGTVVDSATNQPVPQAMVAFIDMANLQIDSNTVEALLNNLRNSKVDTTSSGTDGKFSYTMKIAPNSLIILCGVLKQGYQIGLAGGAALTTTVNMGTIKLQKNDLAAKDTLMVSGKVIDSATGGPLENCLVVMSGLDGMDTVGNIAVTGADGAFSKQVIIGTTFQAVFYVAIKDGYLPAIGQKEYSNKLVDLGTIKVKKSDASVLPGERLFTSQHMQNAIKVYSLNGRLLFSGSMRSFEAIKRQFRNMAIIIMKNGLLTSKRTVLQ